MMGKLPYTALRDAIFAHPTLAESLNNLFGTLDSKLPRFGLVANRDGYDPLSVDD
jgi:hypothetical protein